MEEKQLQPKKTVCAYMDLSADERTRLLEESHQKALWDYNTRMKGAFDKGVQKEKRELLALIEKGYTAEQLRGVLTQQETERL
ncbi:hypothetical protein FACS1894147_05450 [Spirochaetia bacterium]|nr:hypothetical protein FACS1894147_05450 [Spirochaetia bacterium]